jgi:tetratricopeptide (TPR) repeat protein
MTEKDEDYELENSERNSLSQEEAVKSEVDGLGRDNERKDYLEIIDIIGALMHDENFSLKNESSLTINRIQSFLDKEIRDNRNFIEAWLIKGTVFYKTGKYHSAVEAFDNAREIMRKEASKEAMDTWKKRNGINYRYALRFKALALFKLGRYKLGLDALNEILLIYPTDSEIQEYKNILYTLEDENLITELDNLPYNYPKSSINWEDRGKSLYELHEYEEALEKFDKGLEINLEDADIWRYKGSILYKLSRYEEALEAFDRSLEINPKDAKTWSFKGSALYMLDRPEEALKAFDIALQRNPNILEAWFNKGSILFGLGKYKQSLSAVENALRINTKDINALNLKSSIHDKLEQEESVIP